MLKMRYKYWFFLMAALLLAACSKDSDMVKGEPVPGSGSDIPTQTVPDVTERPLNMVAATRALTTDDVSPAGAAFDPIRFFLMAGDQETAITHKTEGEFTYDPDATPHWSSNIGLKALHNCIYGFSPSTAALATISTSSSYKNGATLTLTDISPVTGSDICVIVGVKHADNADETAVENLLPNCGQFYFEKKTQNYVSLLLDHLFAKINFCVRIDHDYHTMRAIKVKKIELLSDKTLTKVTVPLTANSTGESPIGTIVYTTADVSDGEDWPTGTIYDYVYDTDEDHSEGVDIPEDYSWTIPGYFAPGGEADAAIARSLSVRITYDVYAYNVFDNNKEVRVRENCVAVNKLPAITIGEEKTELQRGQSTTITLTVKPTYIYVLYDDELNNPTLTIE